MNYILNTATGEVSLNGVVVAPAQSVDDPAYQEYVAWVNAGNSPIEYTPTTNAADTKITVLALRNRFTTAEKIAIDLASIDNPSGTIDQRRMAAAVRVMLLDLSVAEYVDLTRPDTIAGIRALEQYGIIGAGRADAVLTAPVQDLERANGF